MANDDSDAEFERRYPQKRQGFPTWVILLIVFGLVGFFGLFAPTGIFSQYVIGTAELIASLLLLASLTPKLPLLRPLGALMSLGVISGAIFFHLFTPLGVSVLNADGTRDGGLLFGMACGVWISAAILLVLSREQIMALLQARTRPMAA